MRPYLLLLALSVALAAGDDCKQTSPCTCTFDNGTQISLADVFAAAPNTDGAVYLYDTKDNTTIYYHGCVDVKFDVNILNITQDHCRSPATMCVYDAATQSFLTLGTASEAKFAVDSHRVHTMTYSNGNLVSTVQLVCTPEVDEDNINVHSVSADNTHYNVILYSPHACRTPPPHALSTGTKLLIMLFTFTLVYFIGGALLAYFVRGARGKELIPNIDFWTSLPGLVKDGTVFLLGGCSTRLVTTAETYDQI